MVKLAEQSGITQLGMPRIASGLGGLDWTRVRKVLGEVAGTSPVEIVVFEQFVRNKEPEAP
jgi:O-acetyl-ADP-ribose deacetylase (regulator of RNase III)